MILKEIEQAHVDATEDGRNWYEDPVTGYKVLTEKFLVERGSCCGSGCRHCPFEDEPYEEKELDSESEYDYNID